MRAITKLEFFFCIRMRKIFIFIHNNGEKIWSNIVEMEKGRETLWKYFERLFVGNDFNKPVQWEIYVKYLNLYAS